MEIQSGVKAIVSQSIGSVQGLNSHTPFSGGLRNTQELSADANAFRHALSTSEVHAPPMTSGINNAFQKITGDFSKMERKTLDLAKKPDPVKMMEHSMELSQSMFRLATITKLSSQLGRSFDKLTSLG